MRELIDSLPAGLLGSARFVAGVTSETADDDLEHRVLGPSEILGETVSQRSFGRRHIHLAPSPRARRGLGSTALVAGVLGLVAVGCGGSTDSSQPTTTEARGAQGNQAVNDDAKPVSGGKVTYGLEADTDGFNPTVNRWAISGVMVGLAVYDPLAAYDDKSVVQPYLAKAITANATYTQWTIELRPNVTFSNGKPLTAEAVKAVLDGHLASFLTGAAFTPVKKDGVKVTGPLTVTVDLNSPWVAFPAALTAQTGVIPEPSTLAAGSTDVIGTGPFVQTEYVKDSKWDGKKNPTYWRKDKDGVQLPYLDSVEFRPIPDPKARENALKSGELNMMHTSDADSIGRLRELAKDKSIQLIEDNGEGEEGFIMLNNAKEPFNDVNVRRALAYATDTQAYADEINGGVLEPANGVFKKNSPWFADVKGYPEYDLAKATELVNQYKSEHGGQAPKFSLGYTTGSEKQVQYLQSIWKAAGFDVDLKLYEQSAYIAQTVAGAYVANQWRQFGAPDPDGDYLWWTSENAGIPAGQTLATGGQPVPEGGLTLNIARHASACVDGALKKGRESADLDVRKAAYKDLQQCFADEVPYVWLDHTVWVVGAAANVRGILQGPLPDGQPSLPIGGAGDFGGVTRLTQTWIAPA